VWNVGIVFLMTVVCSATVVPILCGKREPRNKPMRTHRVSGDIAQLFLNLGTRRGRVVTITPQPPLPGKDPVPIVQEAGWAPALV
jgi:hypothetical protein